MPLPSSSSNSSNSLNSSSSTNNSNQTSVPIPTDPDLEEITTLLDEANNLITSDSKAAMLDYMQARLMFSTIEKTNPNRAKIHADLTSLYKRLNATQTPECAAHEKISQTRQLMESNDLDSSKQQIQNLERVKEIQRNVQLADRFDLLKKEYASRIKSAEAKKYVQSKNTASARSAAIAFRDILQDMSKTQQKIQAHVHEKKQFVNAAIVNNDVLSAQAALVEMAHLAADLPVSHKATFDNDIEKLTNKINSKMTNG